MNPRELISLMTIAEKLKCNTRHSWTSSGRRESVAEHSWRLTLFSYFIKDKFPDADIHKVMLMCLVHDLGEAITGDIPSFLKTKENEATEDRAVMELLSSLSAPFKTELTELFEEMNELKTPEARIFKALDKLEAVMQHNEADISTWLPLEYELNITYGDENVSFSEYLTELRAEIKKDTIAKISSKEL